MSGSFVPTFNQPKPGAAPISGNPLATATDENELCQMMKDLLLTGLSTREDFLALGFTEAELDAAGCERDVAPRSPSWSERGTETPWTASHKAARGASLGWTPQTVPTRSHLERTPAVQPPLSPPGSRVRPREAGSPAPNGWAHDEEAGDGVAYRSATTEASEQRGEEAHPPVTSEPLTEARRAERQRDARQAQRFSQCLAEANGVASALSPTRMLFGAAATATTVSPVKAAAVSEGNSALSFTMQDAMAAQETGRLLHLLGNGYGCGDDSRTMESFIKERAALCECDM